MRMSSRVLVAVIVLGAIAATEFASNAGWAQAREEDRRAILARSPSGALDRSDYAALERLTQRADMLGQLVVWVSLNVPFQPDLSKLNEKQVAYQEQTARETAELVMAELIEAGDGAYFGKALQMEGQAFLVVVTAEGIRSLAQKAIVSQIVDAS